MSLLRVNDVREEVELVHQHQNTLHSHHDPHYYVPSLVYVLPQLTITIIRYYYTSIG